ncbi:hypothetical protein M3Y94_01046500 [Aphelenchoides besseyi]|nr:hypothetical protein M3Y94_01046500 [Aphelenchoides besseyi]KAI6224043.1 hypothetical protein M3Y95_00841300 [Aphelenchoides besseyi]
MWSKIVVFVILVLNLPATTEARGGRGGGGRGGGSRSGGFGGRSRGSSGARSGGWFGGSKSSSSSRTSSRGAYVHSYNAKPSYSSGTGRGSMAHSRAFKTAFVGGAASGATRDYVRYHGSTPIIYNPGASYTYFGRPYIFVHSSYYHRGYSGSSYHSSSDLNPYCRMPLNQLVTYDTSSSIISNLPTDEMNMTETTTTEDLMNSTIDYSNYSQEEREAMSNSFISKLQFPNGSQPSELIWKCGYTEICCGTECCEFKEDTPGLSLTTSMGIVFLFLFILLMGCSVYERYNKHKRNETLAQINIQRRNKEETVEMNPSNYYSPHPPNYFPQTENPYSDPTERLYSSVRN